MDNNFIFKSKILIFIIVNFAIFFMQLINSQFSFYVEKYLALFSIEQSNFRVWQLFTYVFVHANFFHIFFNMLGIFFLGTRVEQALGFKNIFLISILSASLTGLCYIIMFQQFILVGASTITYALLVAFAYIYPTQQLAIFGIIPVEARFIAIGLILFDFLSPVLISNKVIMKDSIAHFAHVIGAIISFSYLEIKFKRYLNF